MIWFLIILAIAALAWLERRWAPYAMQFVRYSGQCDKVLAQPGETVTWTSTVENHGRLPIPFIRLELRFPNELKACQVNRTSRQLHRAGIQQWHMEERLSLRPRQSRSRKVSFTPINRGQYSPGGCRLSIGDLLGFQESAREIPAGKLVVMPETARHRPSIEAVSGFLGDLSVRRFILEDPILTIGFRDYTGREPMKDVSWTRTAMTGKLQVKQYDHTAEQTVTVLLNAENASDQELEGSFRLMRSVCEELEHRKIPFSMRTNGNLTGPLGKLFHLDEGLGHQHLNTILYALGKADYTCYHSFSHLVKQALDHRRSNESFIVITPHPAAALNPDIRRLEAASSNPVCILYGSREVDEK